MPAVSDCRCTCEDLYSGLGSRLLGHDSAMQSSSALCLQLLQPRMLMLERLCCSA